MALPSGASGTLTTKLRSYFDSLEPYHAERQALFELLKKPLFRIPDDISDDDFRQLTYEQVKELAAHGFIRITDIRDNPLRYLNLIELVGYVSASAGIKAGVQWTLWGSTIVHLGTERHQAKFVPGFDELKWPGGFAMTELGHGSNVRNLLTTATFDAATNEFVINTPDKTATKWWIGNTAVHGKFVTCFADLVVGDKSQGIHALIVPIRDDNMQPMPGVTIYDCGKKHGLNGVDNGALEFDHVRIPRENLLNKFADVTSEGVYSSSITNSGKRFAAVLTALIGGRVGLCGGALVALKTALVTAVRYAHSRRQFGASKDSGEVLLMEYPSHQYRLVPLVAQMLGLDFAKHYLVQRYVRRTAEDLQDVHILASGLKAVTTWTCLAGIQTCRETCGGHGYSHKNRFGSFRNDLDVFLTFEGDNTVLMQQVTQGLLSQYKEFFAQHPYTGVFLMLRDRMVDSLRERNPVATRRASESHLLSDDFQLSAFEFRVNRLLLSLARKLRGLTSTLGPFNAWNECLLDVLQLAHAYMAKVILEQFQAAVAACKDEASRPILQKFCHLYALHNIWNDIGTFRQLELIKRRKAAAISDEVRRLCKELKDVSLNVMDAVAPPDHVLNTPLGKKDLDYVSHVRETLQATARL